jgi:very-short-patch-repair endonuclease
MEIPDCVKRCSPRVTEWFEEGVACELLEIHPEMTSPIERLLYCALRAVQESWPIPGSEPDKFVGDEMTWTPGLTIQTQVRIGEYRVDFIVTDFKSDGSYLQILVECDSQAWHERSPEEREYEKTRDRFLVSQGYKVFHYSGREITRNPMKVAEEILSEIRAL